MERYRRAGFWSWFRRIFWLRDQRGIVAIPVAIWIIFGVAFFGLLARYDRPKNISQPVEVLSQSVQEIHDINALLPKGDQDVVEKHLINCLCITCQKNKECDDKCDDKYCVVNCFFYKKKNIDDSD